MKPTLVIRAVLWGRLCDLGEKVTEHQSLDAAVGFVAFLAPDARQECYGGEIHFLEGTQEVASIDVKIKDRLQTR